jgi:hypothetical protein
MATTARARLRAGFATMMNAFIVANPTLQTRHFDVKPESPHDFPYTYVELPEAITYSSGVQVRTFIPTLTLVDEYGPNGEVGAEFDILVDALVEFIGGYGGPFGGHITNDSVWSNVTIADGTEDQGESHFPAVRFGFGDLSITEGR